jgi:hypothetical protein
MPAAVGAFSLFTLPQGLGAVAEKLPPLAVPAGSWTVSPDAMSLFAERGNNAMPLWMLRPGTPPAAFLAGEGLWRWRLYAYRYFNQHQVVDECIRQTVMLLAANAQDRPFRVELPKQVWSDGEPVALNAYLLNPAGQPLNTPDVKLRITDSAGRARDFVMDRSGNAYRLQAGIWAAGTYRYAAQVVHQGKTYTATGSFVVQHQPLELLETGADYPLLHGLAHRYHGRMMPWQQTARLVDSLLQDPDLKPVISSRTESFPLVDWKWYFFLILLMATCEWLVRKYWMA